MQCPKCNSDNTQRLEVIFEGGTQDTSGSSTTVGGAHGGAFGVGGAVTSTTSQTQSRLAKKAAPPPKQTYSGAFFTALFGGLLALGSGMVFITGCAFIALGVRIGYKGFKYNADDWPKVYQHWSESWFCNKCGNIYHQA